MIIIVNLNSLPLNNINRVESTTGLLGSNLEALKQKIKAKNSEFSETAKGFQQLEGTLTLTSKRYRAAVTPIEGIFFSTSSKLGLFVVSILAN
ncbi:hypothetical protein L1987_81826 [Smallanthus sonchifolius]|uniref:Uncharacterized protein n=1 Tax=Smallanthus sonchifolius TaxID=185202 RepID=A0ACB8YS58_9ASTR|nr:hypothetical protein L1987_81826 [Smallanthus sonchifolius]